MRRFKHEKWPWIPILVKLKLEGFDKVPMASISNGGEKTGIKWAFK
jgi:hypothetical protein